MQFVGFLLSDPEIFAGGACLGDGSEVQVVGFLLGCLGSACLGDVNRVQVEFLLGGR